MEYSSECIHDIGTSAYIMEKVFLAACYCLSQQYYQQNPRLVLLQEKTASSTVLTIAVQYCSDNPHGAVVLTKSAFSTAPTPCFEQYYQQNQRLVLLRQLEWSSTINRIGIQYCSHNPNGAVLSTKSAFSTAPTARIEQYYQQNPHLVLLQEKTASSTVLTIAVQYCSDNPNGAVVLTESAFSAAPTARIEQYYQQNPRPVLLSNRRTIHLVVSKPPSVSRKAGKISVSLLKSPSARSAFNPFKPPSISFKPLQSYSTSENP